MSMNVLKSVASKPILILVMGVSGSGKTTVAKEVCKHFSFEFVEADDFHGAASVEHMAKGKPLTDDMREPWILKLETHLRKRAENNQNIVLACSGLRRLHRERLLVDAFKSYTIFLSGDVDLIRERLNTRADHFFPSGLLESQFETLEVAADEAGIYNVDIARSLPEVLADVYGYIEHVIEGKVCDEIRV